MKLISKIKEKIKRKSLILSFIFFLFFFKYSKQKTFIIKKFKNLSKYKGIPRFGKICQNRYIGIWNSKSKNQNQFIFSEIGKIQINLSISPGNSILLQLLIFEKIYQDSRFMKSETKFQIQDTVNSKVVISDSFLIRKHKIIFLASDTQTCTLTLALNLRNKQTREPMKFISNDIKNIEIYGNITSRQCQIDLDFKINTFPTFHSEGISFMIVTLIFQCVSLFILIRIIQRNVEAHLLLLDRWILYIHMSLDFGIFCFCLFFSMNYLPQYAFYLSLIGITYLISFLVKSILCWKQYKFDHHRNAHLYSQTQKNRVCFAIINMICLIFGLVFGLVFFQLNTFYVLFFMFPLFQIIKNCFSESRENYFVYWIHISVFLAYLPFVFFIKGYRSFFDLNYFPYLFPLTCFQMSFFLVFLFLQKKYGRFYFIPKCIRPGYYQYKRRLLKNSKNHLESCSICLSNLGEIPGLLETDNEKEEKLLPTKFMKTPCNHHFHINCLEDWMKYNKVCPLCKTSLPSF